jgi:hypothetical protein
LWRVGFPSTRSIERTIEYWMKCQALRIDIA